MGSRLRQGLAGNSDILIAIGVIGIIVMMVIPLPAFMLDLLLALNLTVALIVVLVTMYTTEALQFSVFPSLLLVTTLFRLALNVSSTRLILLNGYAGEIIRRFGEFVIGGNPVVGFVVFCILAVIQFIVITRGAERVAEVAARFTLDAMPGKQMAIDADLNSGLVDEAGARQRRREVEREADFYGAMDGASKFVKGDAIAGIIIILINLIGGFVIGAVQRGLPLAQALQDYSLLTVGDGLVTQIPALLISTATGIVVTRSASEANMGQDLIAQLFSRPRVMFIAAGMLTVLALVPGLPSIPFFALAGCSGTVGYVLHQLDQEQRRAEVQAEQQSDRERSRMPENLTAMMQVDPLEIDLGYGLIGLAGSNGDGELMERIVLLRRQIALDLGCVVPPIRVRDNMNLGPNAYVIRLKGVAAGQGELFLDRYMAMAPVGDEEPLEGIPTREPAFGLPAVWISAAERDKAERAGYTVVDGPSVVATHLVEVIRGNIHELLTRQEVKKLIEGVREHSSAVVDELIPDIMTLGDLQKVLRNLLREGIPIRDLTTVLETAADYGRMVRDPDQLTEYVRQALFRTISARFAEGGELRAVTLSSEVEQAVLDGVQETERGTIIAVDPVQLDMIIKSTTAQLEAAMAQGCDPVILCSAAVRPYFRRIGERISPRIVVLSYSELDPQVRVNTSGVVSLGER